jgi:hypothetical protein
MALGRIDGPASVKAAGDHCGGIMLDIARCSKWRMLDMADAGYGGRSMWQES